MQFALSPEQAAIQARTRQVATTFASRAAEIDRTGRFPAENFRELHAAGLLGLLIPRRHGGLEADIVSYILACEEVGRACGSTALPFLQHQANCRAIVLGAGAASRAVYLEAVIGRGALVGIALSEPGSGSRVVPQVGSRRHGDGYRLQGRKFFVTAAGHATYFLVNARALDAANADGADVFVVEPGATRGVRFEGQWDAMGLRGTCSRDLIFEDAEIPAAARLGEEGEGGAVLAPVGGIFSLGMGAAYLGMAQAALDRAGAFIGSRVQYPDTATLAHQQGLRFAFADAYAGLQAARWLLYQAGWQFEQDYQAAAVQVAAAKLTCITAGMRAADCAVQLSGGRGYLRGELVERVYRDIRAGALMTLNAEGCREAIAKPLLGVE